MAKSWLLPLALVPMALAAAGAGCTRRSPKPQPSPAAAAPADDSGAAPAAGVSGAAGSATPGKPNCLANGAEAVIADNHGHSLEIPANDIYVMADKVYSIQGSADHDHGVTVTAPLLSKLQVNDDAKVTSQPNPVASPTEGETPKPSHTHAIILRCR